MPRFLTTLSIALALVVSAAGAYAPAVHAQSSSGSADQAAASAQVAAQPPPAATAPTGGGTNNPSTLPADPPKDSSFGTVMTWIMSLFAWLLGVAVITLDNVVYYTVVIMGTYVKGLPAVGLTWSILRDIGNIVLIFGFLAIGITTILNVNWYGGGTKMLPMLLIAAVFLNFSLFISEAIIDAGNLFATEFYTQINGGAPPQPVSFGGNAIHNEGISNKIMSQLGLASIYGAALNGGQILKPGSTWLIGFMGIILFMVAAFVMFSLAFILVARFVALIFLIIIAPIGFAGLAVPKLSNTARLWWSTLFEQTITAPILLLLLYIALRVITDSSFLTGFGLDSGSGAATGAWDGFVNNTNLAGFASVMLSFIVAMGLLLGVVIVSKKMSAFGGGWATKWGGKLSFGLVAAGSRSTVGLGSQRFSEKWKNSRLGRTAVVGRLGSGILDRGAKASYDVRGTSALKKLPFGGVDAGVAQKGGYRKWEEEKIKGRETYAKSLGQTKGEKEMQATEEGRKKMMERTVKDIKSQNEQERQELLDKHKEELKPFNERINAERNALIAAEASGNEEMIGRTQLAFNNALLDSQRKREEQAKEVEELKSIHGKMVKVQEAEVEARQDEVDKLKRAPQEGYAKSIVWGPEQFFNRNKKASEKILKEVKKKQSEKDFDSIKKLLEESEKKTSGSEEKEEERKEGKKPEAGH
ncbi:hypothetical protein KGQ25_02180 [Patescibacteria group bacterium]|nr:hypothetical protein [Patescibacteria group bacterium]